MGRWYERGLDSSFEEDADGHFCDGLGSRCFISLDLVDSDIVLAISC